MTSRKPQEDQQTSRTDFPGLENEPDCLKPVYESWERWLQTKQNPPVQTQENQQ